MLLKELLAIFTRKFVPKIDRKLSEKQVKNVKKTSLKLFPSTPKLQINQPVNFLIFPYFSVADWFICYFRVLGKSFREVFWTFLTCFSGSFRSIVGTIFP